MKNILSINKAAAGAIPRGSIVKYDSTDDTVVVSTADTDAQLGVMDQATAAASGDRVDIMIMGIANTLAGGTITRGAFVQTDSAGAAITSDGTSRIIGMALVSAVVGDLFPVLLTPGKEVVA